MIHNIHNIQYVTDREIQQLFLNPNLTSFYAFEGKQAHVGVRKREVPLQS